MGRCVPYGTLGHASHQEDSWVRWYNIVGIMFLKCLGYARIISYHGQEQKYDTRRERSPNDIIII
ncbi:MAG: hypothetical protein JRJ43_05085 [Deltaproteobacteria bacterium]|nr:hypothetical protein [Deltaproteobacteria bacterium]MBW1718926.1 hypothetical protein [Deltaproteobacteria bacterium]MBW1933248.1 hypothetical protein [Deltaproteobacteria bacterium]